MSQGRLRIEVSVEEEDRAARRELGMSVERVWLERRPHRADLRVLDGASPADGERVAARLHLVDRGRRRLPQIGRDDVPVQHLRLGRGLGGAGQQVLGGALERLDGREVLRGASIDATQEREGDDAKIVALEQGLHEPAQALTGQLRARTGTRRDFTGDA